MTSPPATGSPPSSCRSWPPTKQQQKARGEFLGGIVPFGYARSEDGLRRIEVPAQQAAIRRIRALRAQGLSAQKISAALRADGTAKVSHVTVLKILGRAGAERRAA